MAFKGEPIDSIVGIDQAIKDILKGYYINSIEAFLSLYEEGYGEDLRILLGISRDDFGNLISLARQTLNSVIGITYIIPRRSQRPYPLGASVPKSKNIPFSAQPPVLQSRPNFTELKRLMSPVKDQGERGTCVAFAVLAAFESMHIRDSNITLDFSEQCLYFQCKQRDKLPNEEGTLVSCAVDILIQEGVCDEMKWPYNSKYNTQNISQGPPPSQCNPHSGKYRISSTPSEPYPGFIDNLKERLSNNWAIVVNFPVFESWYNSGWTEDTGEISMPFPIDLANPSRYKGNHCVCLAGYDDSSNTFIFKNSWGINWAKNSIYGAGYGQIPYEYIKNYCHEVHCLG